MSWRNTPDTGASWQRTGTDVPHLWLKPQAPLAHGTVTCTRPALGVDVGARQQIYTVIRDAARAGAAVVCASADYEQLAALCDRVVIVARGRVARQLVGADLTKDRIAEQCLMSIALRA